MNEQQRHVDVQHQRLYPLHPGWLIFLTLFAGLAASGPLAGAVLFRCGRRALGWIIGFIFGILGAVLLLAAILWNVEWYWAALTLSTVHLIFGVAFFFGLRKPYRRFREIHPKTKMRRGNYRTVLVGIAGGAFLSIPLGMFCSNIYLLAIDRFFSTLMPVTFEDEFAVYRLFLSVFFFTFAGTISGGLLGFFRHKISAVQVLLYGAGLVWVYFTWQFALELSIAAPGFQAGAATSGGWSALLTSFSSSNFFFGFWWTAFLFFFLIAPPKLSGKLGRAIQIVGINLAAALTLSIHMGFPADMFLALGRHFEREALTPQALWSYERGLNKEPAERTASYLQYRIALLHHKLGNSDKAIRGFQRVVAKYTWNDELVKKANRFLDNLERSSETKRVVLPGVEMRTEYKGGYCVPNSLALVMKFWGSDVSAKEIGERITGLGSGTFVVNQRWYAEQEGFRHDFLPLAGLEDIKRSIDAGFPVLVYVPAHIFVIVGYDEALETFVTYDVATRDVWVEYIQKDFIKSWKRQATTLVLAYPPEKEELIPEDIRERLVRLSDNYLHFQLHYFDAPEGDISVPHLLKAAGDEGEFFFPVTMLYAEYPGLRETLDEQYSPEQISNSIQTYFAEDYDEGGHLWGQYHNENWANPDWALNYSIQYLIGQQQFELIDDIISRIDDEGKISEQVLAERGMLTLARGEFDRGIHQLTSTEGRSDNQFYIGLAHLQQGAEQEAVRYLAEVIHARSGGRNSLDDYGFPESAVTNRILIQLGEYGNSQERLEEEWEQWLHRLPYDAPIAEALATLYEQRLEKLNLEKDAAAHQRLERKLKLAQSRAARYKLPLFSGSGVQK